MWATGAYGYPLDYLLWCGLCASLVAHTWCFFRFFPRQRHRRVGLVLGNLLVGLCMLGTIAIAAESYVRFVSIATDGMGASLTNKRWKLAYARINSMFCRDKEWAMPKPAGVTRIAFVGDSFVYGWGVNDPADRFTDILHSRLDGVGRGRYEVMNVAWAAWDTPKESAAVREWLPPYEISELVLCYLPNDIEWVVPRADDMDIREPLRPRLVNPESSFLFDYVFHRVVAPRLRHGPPYTDWLADVYADPDHWRSQRGELEQLIAFSRERGIRLRVVLLPLLQTEGSRYDAAKVHAQVAEVFAAAGVPCLDLLPALQGMDIDNLRVNRFDAHPNEIAHRLFAERIWDAFYAK